MQPVYLQRMVPKHIMPHAVTKILQDFSANLTQNQTNRVYIVLFDFSRALHALRRRVVAVIRKWLSVWLAKRIVTIDTKSLTEVFRPRRFL